MNPGRLTKVETERFLEVMLAWEEGRADDGTTLGRLLRLAALARKRLKEA
jgi:hypothetical protein